MFKDFTNWTVTTSKHKTNEDAIACALLGLGGEMYEYIEKRYEDFNVPEEEIKKELGDLCWYIGHLSYRIGYEPKVIDHFIKIERDGIATVFRLQELFKKVIRDNQYEITDKYRDRIHILISQLLSMVVNECDSWGWRLNNILDLVMGKLEDRKERGMIGGEGDNR